MSFYVNKLLPSHHRVVQAILGQPDVALDARVAERRVLVAPEGKHRLIHLLGVEHFEAYQ